MLFNLLLILSLYLPFQLALNPAEGIDLASVRIFILLLFFLWLAVSLKNKKLVIKNTALTFFILSFLFLNLFSSFFAQNYLWSLRKLLFLFSIFPIYFVASALTNSAGKRERLLKFITLSGALAATIGILQFISQFFFGLESLLKIWTICATPFLGKNVSATVAAHPAWLVNISDQTVFRAISIFPDPHMFSFFLGLLLPFSLGLFFLSRKKIWLLTFSLIFIADILTFSRGGYIGLAGGFLFALLFFRNKIEKKYRLTILFGSFLIFLAILFPNLISQRFFSSFNLTEGSNIGRLEMWRKAAETIKNNPLVGVGLGNFPLEVDPLTDYRTPIYAHSTYLDIAAEIGLLGVFAWLGLLFFALAKFLKNSGDMLSFCGATSLIIFSFHSIFETGLYSPVILMLFLIILALSNFEKTNAQIS